MKDQNNFQDFKALVFKVGNEEFGININQVISIERMRSLTITPFPNRPAHVLGFASIRSIVTPIVDLRDALTSDSIKSTEGSRIIIVKVFEEEIGLVVDAASAVLEIDSATIQIPKLMEENNVSYLYGVSHLDDKLLFLLDIELLLEDTTNFDELREMINNIDRKELMESDTGDVHNVK